MPRVLGPVAALACVVGSVIGSGIFRVPARIAEYVPYLGGIALVWVVGGLFSLAGALSMAELSAMLPQAGGPYVYLREAFGRLPAFLFGWTEFLVIRAGSVATLAAGFATYFAQLVPAPGGMDHRVWELLVALTAMGTVAAINAVGTRVGGGVQVAGTAIKLGALGLMIALPFVLGRADPALLSPVWPAGSVAPSSLFNGFMMALVSALWAYDGWANAGSLAEDIVDPGRNVPRALILGMFTLIGVYLSMALVYHLVVPLDAVRASTGAPGTRLIAAEFCYRLAGPGGATAIALVVMSSIYIALNGNAMSGPRAYFAMARDGLFPRALAAIHPRFRTPANAILSQTLWAMTLTIAGTFFVVAPPPGAGLPRFLAGAWEKLHATPLYDLLYNYVIFGATIFYAASIASVFVLRRTRPDLPRPYRAWGYPFTPAAYLVASFVLLGSMLVERPGESFSGLAVILVGVALYPLFSRSRPGAGARPDDTRA